MKNKNKINFREISEKVDTLIDLADDKSMIDSYRTTDFLKMVEEDFDKITATLSSLPDIDVHKDR